LPDFWARGADDSFMIRCRFGPRPEVGSTLRPGQ
jgi:hypothetical protein